MKAGVDYVGVGVGVLIFDEQGRAFMSRRGKACRNEIGFWEFPGGGVDFGETLEETIKREIKEEYGIDIGNLELIGIVDHILDEEKQHWVAPTFIGKIKKGKPKILEPEKCDKIGWFNLDSLPEKISLVSKLSLELYDDHLRKQRN